MIGDALDWDQPATLVQHLAGDDRAVAFEGPLRAVLHHAASIPATHQPTYSIRLPERRTAPHGFEWVHFAALLSQLREACGEMPSSA